MTRATALATAGEDPDDIVRASLDALERVFDAVRADVWRFDDDGQLVHVAGRGVGGDVPLVATPMLVDVARDGLAQQLPGDALGDDESTTAWRRLLFQVGCRELGVYSLASHGQSIGCITLFRKPDGLDLCEELASFASAVASAVLQATARRDAARAAEAASMQTEVLIELASCRGPECVARVLGRVVGQVDAAATVHLVVASVGGRTARLTVRADGRRGGRARVVASTILDAHARGALALVGHEPTALDAPTRALFGWGDDVACGEGGLLGVAMHAGEETVGWLLVEASDDESHAPVLALLAVIAPAVAVSLVNAMKFTAMKLHGERLAAANSLARALGSITDFELLVDRLALGIEEVLGCNRVAVYDSKLALLVDHGAAAAPRSELRLVRAALRAEESQHRSGSDGIDAFAVPLAHLENVRAILYVERPDAVGSSFDDHDRALLENVAEQANATLAVIAACEELEQNYLSTIQALAGALEASDQYTHDHAQDVAKWAVEVGRRLGMDTRDLRDLELGAVFHDIGKIAIPNEILNKPGKLTDAEFEVMKTHTIIGERIIAPIAFLERVRPIVRHEHERWDGRGYPDGISGEQIPLGSRIIFVCDAYHAITSTRPYRNAQPHSVARQVLVENAGTQFDPAVVSVFLDVIEDHLGGQGASLPLELPAAHQPARIDIAPARAAMVHRQTDVA